LDASGNFIAFDPQNLAVNGEKIMDTVRFVYITMDGLHNAALRTAARQLEANHGIRMQLGLHQMASLHTETDWQRLEKDMRQADFIFRLHDFWRGACTAVARDPRLAGDPHLLHYQQPGADLQHAAG
jgi:hypothetical protein